MADTVDAVLRYLSENDSVDTYDLAKLLNEDHQKVVGAVKSVQSLGDVSHLLVLFITVILRCRYKVQHIASCVIQGIQF